MSAYTVIYECDEAGWWVADVPAVPGCHTQGRTVEQARARIRDALSLYVEDAGTADLHDIIRQPASTPGGQTGA